jgi:hypothetical protein
VEDDNIPSLWRMEEVGQFADHQALAIMKVRLHAGLDDPELQKAQTDYPVDDEGENDGLYDLANKRFGLRPAVLFFFWGFLVQDEPPFGSDYITIFLARQAYRRCNFDVACYTRWRKCRGCGYPLF